MRTRSPHASLPIQSRAGPQGHMFIILLAGSVHQVKSYISDLIARKTDRHIFTYIYPSTYLPTYTLQ